MKNIWIVIIIIAIITAGFYFYGQNPNSDNPVQIKFEFTKDMAEEIAYAETQFNPAEEARSSNIALALSTLNDIEVRPGETFSLNEALGERTAENGYKEAPVIVDGDMESGIGGGICQVATTLYNAVIKTDMEVVERKHHEFPPAYTQAGQDATISGNEIDFKFKNTTEYPVFIVAGINNENKACISLLSKLKNPNRRVEIESELLSVEEPSANKIIKDNSIDEGESVVTRKSKKGYKVAVYKAIYENDVLVNRVLVTTDTYEPIRGITKISE